MTVDVKQSIKMHIKTTGGNDQTLTLNIKVTREESIYFYICLTYKKKLKCSKEELILQFRKGLPVICELSREIRHSKDTLSP